MSPEYKDLIQQMTRSLCILLDDAGRNEDARILQEMLERAVQGESISRAIKRWQDERPLDLAKARQ